MIRPPGRRLRLLAAVAVLPLVFAACAAGSPPDDGVASLASPGTGATAASPSPAASRNPEDAMLDFAQCMRDNGVDMPDPQSGGGMIIAGGTSRAVGAGGIDPGAETFQAAQEACQHFLDEAGFGGPRELSQEQLDQMVAFAGCMREHGIDLPDPGADGSVRIEIRGQAGTAEGGPVGPGAIDPSSDEFQAAQEACSDLMPGFGPAAGGPGDPVTNTTSPAP